MMLFDELKKLINKYENRKREGEYISYKLFVKEVLELVYKYSKGNLEL